MKVDYKKRLLLVEDEILIALGKQIELEKYGYSVLTVNTGEKAIDISKGKKDIDLILMDIDLGKGIDGTEAAEIILKNRNLPIVFLSSHTEPEVVEKTEKITSYGYVVKGSSITVCDASIKMAFKLFDANRKSEAHRQNLSTTLNSIGDAVIATDTKGIVTKINPVAEKLTGWNVERAYGMPLTDIFKIVNTETRKPVQNPVNKVLEDGNIVGLANHTVLIAKDGREYQIADSASPIIDNEGEITGVVLVFRNVTEEYKIQKELKDSETKLKEAQCLAKIGNWDLDLITGKLYWSNEIYRIFDINPKQFSADFEAFLKTIHPDDRDFVNDAYTKSVKNKTPYNINHRLLLKNGLGKIVNECCETYYDEKGKPIRSVGTVQDITYRKKVEDELKESTNMLNDVLNTIPVRVFWKDLDGVYLGCNKLFAQDAGRSTPEEVIGNTDYNMGWAERAELYRKDDRNVIKSGQPKINYEELVPTPESKFNWVNTSKIPLRNDEGLIYGMLGTYENITKRKEMERSLSEANSIINRSPIVAFLWKNKKNWPVEFVTKNVEKLFGYTSQEFMEEKIFYSNIIHISDFKRVAEEVNSFSQKEGVKSFPHEPYRIITKNKVTKWVSDTTYIRRNSRGIITHYEGIITDITNQMEVEEKLRLSELRYKSIFQKNHAVILLIDPDTAKIADANSAACRYYGWTYEEIISKKITDINVMKPKELYSSIKLVLKEKQNHFFFRHRMASDEIRDVEVYTGLINIKKQKLLYSLIHDITDRKIAENKLNHQLLEKEIILKEVHHRIKNNLASVGSLLTLQAQSATNPEVQSALQDAIGRVNSMHVLYEKLIITDNYKVTSVREYLTNLIDDIINMFSESIEITVEKQIDDFGLDPKRLVPVGIIINELLTNIMKYAFIGKTSGLIKIIVKEKQGNVSLTVQDNGIGLPEEFDIDTENGFGLMLIKLLTEQLNGSFKIDNHIGTKSTLKFSI